MANAYILCGTPRTGSTLLCEMLRSTGRAGQPNSYFRPQSLRNWARRWQLHHADATGTPQLDAPYLKAAIESGTAGTGIFGLRLMYENLDGLIDLLDRLHPGLDTDLARLTAAFGSTLFVHLSRNDKLAQAISLVKAEQTGLWHRAADGSDYERIGEPCEPSYDFCRIRDQIRLLEADDAAWRSWFTAEGISPLSLTYEDLSADPAGAVVGLCKALGITELERSSLQPAVTRLADSVSRDWSERYRRDCRTITQS